MKYLPILGMTISMVACAAGPTASLQSVGTSTKAPADVGQCIAAQWATATQQQVTVQTTQANNQSVDVLMPGQPPGGSAAVVRPSYQGSGTWVGMRTVAGVAPPAGATSAISSCL